jgi:hypothetical protein
LKAGLMLASNPQKRSRDALQPLPHAFGRDARSRPDLGKGPTFCPAAVDRRALGIEQRVHLCQVFLERLSAEPHAPCTACGSQAVRLGVLLTAWTGRVVGIQQRHGARLEALSVPRAVPEGLVPLAGESVDLPAMTPGQS